MFNIIYYTCAVLILSILVVHALAISEREAANSRQTLEHRIVMRTRAHAQCVEFTRKSWDSPFFFFCDPSPRPVIEITYILPISIPFEHRVLLSRSTQCSK